MMLRLHGLYFRYREDAPWVVDGIDLEFVRGEIFGLLGPNGAGKTTVISLIVGLLAPARGSIERAAEAGRPTLVPQDLAFYPMLTGRENLAFFGGMLGLSGHSLARRIDYCIAFAGLEKFIGSRAERYSGGLKRRLNLAIGMLADPELLLFDEPTVGVDPQSRAFILDAIRQLRAAGKTVIYTSHYMEEVEYLCDRIAIIDAGRVLAQGRLADLLSGGEGLRLTFREPPPEPFLEALRIHAEVLIQAPQTLLLRTPLRQPLSGLLALAETQGVEVVRVQRGAKNLEEVFMDLTQRSLRD
jgi:ABC-2 type transport system ATP-binding protein